MNRTIQRPREIGFKLQAFNNRAARGVLSLCRTTCARPVVAWSYRRVMRGNLDLSLTHTVATRDPEVRAISKVSTSHCSGDRGEPFDRSTLYTTARTQSGSQLALLSLSLSRLKTYRADRVAVTHLLLSSEEAKPERSSSLLPHTFHRGDLNSRLIGLRNEISDQLSKTTSCTTVQPVL